jgi:4-hydroxy-tetrahydrodipicolinate synthase
MLFPARRGPDPRSPRAPPSTTAAYAMNDGKTAWRGAFPSIVTPFDADGGINEPLLRQNVEMTLAEGARGIVIGAHNGESPAMDPEERVSVMRIGIDQVARRVPVLCGAEHVRTARAVALADAARSLGADGVVVEAPAYLRPSEDDVLHFMSSVSEVGVPIMIYNQPRRSGFAISPALLDRLAGIEQVVALMDSAGDFTLLTEFLAVAGGRIGVFVGTTRLYGFPAVALGAAGFVDGLPQILGRDVADLYDHAAAGRLAQARALQSRCGAAGAALFERITTHAYPATLKAAMNLLGRPGGLPRPPLRPLDEAALARLAALLRDAGLAVGGARAAAF